MIFHVLPSELASILSWSVLSCFVMRAWRFRGEFFHARSPDLSCSLVCIGVALLAFLSIAWPRQLGSDSEKDC